MLSQGKQYFLYPCINLESNIGQEKRYISICTLLTPLLIREILVFLFYLVRLYKNIKQRSVFCERQVAVTFRFEYSNRVHDCISFLLHTHGHLIEREKTVTCVSLKGLNNCFFSKVLRH